MKQNCELYNPDDFRDDLLGKNHSKRNTDKTPQENTSDTLPRRKRIKDLGDSL